MFRHSPAVRKIDKHKWQLLERFILHDVEVPEGFHTDGASVPRLFWWVFSPAGTLFEAAIIHDYLYISGKTSKQHADDLFYQIALEYKANPFLAKLAHIAVKLFGIWRS